MTFVKLKKVSGDAEVYVNPNQIRWIEDDGDPEAPVTTLSCTGAALYVKGTAEEIVTEISRQTHWNIS